jgi:hypothetical protein
MALVTKVVVALANWGTPPPPAEIGGVWFGQADQIPMSIASSYMVRPMQTSLHPPLTHFLSAKCA